MKAFFKSVLRQAAVQMLASLLILVIAFIFLMSLFSGLTSSNLATPVESGSFLTINLSTKITDSPPAMDPAEMILQSVLDEEGTGTHLYKVLEAIEAATKDPDIKGIYLHGNYMPYENSTGYAGLREIRDALLKFQKSEKPVFASAFSPNLQTYYLISSASHLFLNPFSDIQLNGIGGEYTFFAPALEKLGVGIQPVRVGKYKAAIEPFTRETFSEEAREQIQTILDERWETIFQEIAANRGMEEDKLRAILDKEFNFDSEEALEAGLVDQLATRSEIYAEVLKFGKWDEEIASFQQISLQEYTGAMDLELDAEEAENTIAVVYVEGAIINGRSSPGYAGSETLHRQLTKLSHRKEVKSIVLRVNSPGGSATASEIIQQALLDCKAKGKKLVVSMGATAASGGYWVSAPADRILAQPETITGSIGVFGMLFDIQKLGEKLGLTWDSVSTGQHINPYAISRPKTPEEIEEVQEYVDNIYQAFLENVADHRKLDADAVDAIAQGRVWSARQALENKLVDEIGGLQDAIQAGADQAGLHVFKVEHFPEDLSEMELLEKFIEENFSSLHQSSANPVQMEVRKLQNQLKSLQKWNDPKHIYARLPFELP